MEVAHRALVLLLLASGNAFDKRPSQVMPGTSGAYPSGGSQESRPSRPCTSCLLTCPSLPQGCPLLLRLFCPSCFTLSPWQGLRTCPVLPGRLLRVFRMPALTSPSRGGFPGYPQPLPCSRRLFFSDSFSSWHSSQPDMTMFGICWPVYGLSPGLTP